MGGHTIGYRWSHFHHWISQKQQEWLPDLSKHDRNSLSNLGSMQPALLGGIGELYHLCSFVSSRSHFTDLDHVIQKQHNICSTADPSHPFTSSDDEESVCQTPSGEMLPLIGTKKQLSIMIRALQSVVWSAPRVH